MELLIQSQARRALVASPSPGSSTGTSPLHQRLCKAPRSCRTGPGWGAELQSQRGFWGDTSGTAQLIPTFHVRFPTRAPRRSLHALPVCIPTFLTHSHLSCTSTPLKHSPHLHPNTSRTLTPQTAPSCTPTLLTRSLPCRLSPCAPQQLLHIPYTPLHPNNPWNLQHFSHPNNRLHTSPFAPQQPLAPPPCSHPKTSCTPPYVLSPPCTPSTSCTPATPRIPLSHSPFAPP